MGEGSTVQAGGPELRTQHPNKSLVQGCVSRAPAQRGRDRSVGLRSLVILPLEVFVPMHPNSRAIKVQSDHT